MTNFDVAQETTQLATDEFAGSAEKEMDNVRESVQYSIDQLKVSFQELSMDFLSSDLLKGLAESGTVLLNVLDAIVGRIGILGTSLAGLGIYKVAKNFESLKETLSDTLYIFDIAKKTGGDKEIMDLAFDNDTIKWIIQYSLYNNIVYIDKVSHYTGISINDLAKIFNILKISNRPLRVKCKCDECGKEIEKGLSAYLKTDHHFCSSSCNGRHNHKIHPQIKKIETTCTNCGKQISIIPFDFKKENSFGDSHHFCSKQCYYDFRSKYYVKEKSSMYGIKLNGEQLNKLRNNLMINRSKANRLNTSIQKHVNDMLDLLHVKYEREKIIKYYSIDNYLPNQNLAIEVMGDYWHVSPILYNIHGKAINKSQYRDIIKDKSKNTYLNNNGIKTLYLWEKDINKNPDLCLCLINLFIRSNGNILNSNSFNWELKDGELSLKQNIIHPYFELPNSEYRKLLNKQNKTKSVTTTGDMRQRIS